MKKVEMCKEEMDGDVSTPKKRQLKAQEDEAEKPKKPRSAYLLYYFDVHQLMQQEVPNLPQYEINKRISESWKRLSVAEKAFYLERAKYEKEGLDTSSLNYPNDLPGFRKILPRASYVLLSNGCSSNPQPGVPQSEGSVESVDPTAPASFTQEPQFSSVGLACEVELSEVPIAVDEGDTETTLVLHPSVPQGIPSSSSSSSVPSKALTSVAQGSNDLTANMVTPKGHEAGATSRDFGWAMVQKVQGGPAQVMTIIPSQKLLEPKAIVSPVGPVMMVSVGAKGSQIFPKSSFNTSMKTYTRRGRGKCINPRCSYAYVTRHKPPICPACGFHLGGKLMPAIKKNKERKTASKAKAKSVEDIKPKNQDEKTDVDKSDTRENTQVEEVEGCSKKLRSVSSPPEGSSTKPKEQTIQVNDPVQGQDRSTAVVPKRPVRPILPANCNTGRAVFQILTVPPDKEKYQTANNQSSPAEARGSFSGLKPNTLKQLGQTVPESPASADGSQAVTSLTGVNIVSVVPFKRHTVSNFDLGLSTARGRGRCKNPSCNYIYKNRHKPAVCPKCGCELTQKNFKGIKSETLLDPYHPLGPAQKDIQRQSTLQLLRRSMQFPESEVELQETLNLIQELNSLQIILLQPAHQEHKDNMGTETLVESAWPQFYESSATHCGLCNYPLFKGGQSTAAGQEDCWLITETLMQTASLQLKVCQNVQCLALHSFTDLHPGLFNIGNKVLVSIDLFLKIRANIKLGHTPAHAAKTLLDHIPHHPVHALSPEESSHIQDLILSGFWAFECLTVRDYNDMICGICGVAPKVEIAQRHTNNVLELKHVEFTWPEYSVSDEVHTDDFWLTMESEAIEQAAFPTDIPITRVDASIIAPFIPPLMRSATVINTEKDKASAQIEQPLGDPSVLVRLIHDGQLRLDKIEEHTEDELRTMLGVCGANVNPGSTKDELLATLVSMYTHVHSGLSTAPQPPQHLTGGKLSKVCCHKVVCGSKYLVRGETARDHVDLLLSSRYWPPVYVSDCARQVAICTDTQYPEMATQMWSRNQGCFSDPFEKAVFVSCAELQDQPYSAALSSGAENLQVHPITKSSSRWLVHPPGAEQLEEEPSTPPEHHSMSLCRDLEPYVVLVAELERDKVDGLTEKDCTEKSEEDTSLSQSPAVVFSNTAYYYLYNRLVDFLSSRDIVSQQINQVLQDCQPGEVVIRDALFRLGVAQQIKSEREFKVDGGCGAEGQTKEGETETYEVVLSEQQC